MKSLVAAALVATLVVAGCGTRLNPFNWFGPSEETLNAAPETFTNDLRPLVAQVTALKIDRTPDGAIIRAVGLPPTQGFWQAELVPLNRGEPDENRTLSFEFRAFEPLDPARVSTEQSREVVVGQFISSFALRDVRRISVVGASNTRTVNR